MIRPALSSDLPQLLEILNAAILNSTAVYEYETWSLEKMSVWYESRISEGFPVIVFEEENKALGYATFGSFRKRVAYRFTVEHSVYVHEKYRNQGMGKKLLTELIRLAVSHGARSMIGVVDATNIRSITFHKKFGFHEAGLLREVGHKFDIWLDVALLQRML